MEEEAAISQQPPVGILNMPLHIIEKVCQHLLDTQPEMFGSSASFDISLEFPRDILSFRATCRQLRDTIDESKLEFFVSIGTLLTLKEWPILDFVLHKPMWKVTELQVNVLWKKVEALNRTTRFAKLMDNYRQVFQVKRLRLLWNGFNPYEQDSLSYFKTALGEVLSNTLSAKIELTFYSIPETVKLEDAEVMPNVDKLIAPLVGEHNSSSTLKFLVHLCPNLECLYYGYHLSSVAPLRSLQYLKHLEIEIVQMDGRVNLVALTSITHLCFRISSYESPFSLSDFIVKCFPNLDTLQLASFNDEHHFANLSSLAIQCATVQLPFKFLYMFADNEYVENLGIETIWKEQDFDELVKIVSHLQSLTFGLVATLEQTCVDYIPRILLRFEHLNFLIVNVFDSSHADECEDFDDVALDFFHDISELLASHPVKLILLINGCSESNEQFVYMKQTLTRHDINQLKMMLNDFIRVVRYDFVANFSTNVDSSRSCAHF